MKLLVINPNTTAPMTRQIARAAQAAARPDTQIVATNPAEGPASIQGYYDIAACMGGLLAEAARHTDADAVIVACFDDTGLDALRCHFDVPVIGIGEAAYHAASMISTRFAVVTTLARSVPGLETNLARYGLGVRCAGIRASDVPVLELEAGNAEARIEEEAERAVREDRADCIVLGCAGMAGLNERLSARFGIPVIDGIAAAVGFAEALVAAGLRTSKRGGYANPSAAA